MNITDHYYYYYQFCELTETVRLSSWGNRSAQEPIRTQNSLHAILFSTQENKMKILKTS